MGSGPSCKSSSSYDSSRDNRVSMPETPENPAKLSHELQLLHSNATIVEAKVSWRSLFVFTTRAHSSTITVAIVSTFLSCLIKPASAIFLGKIFTHLAAFGAGDVSAQDTLHNVSLWCIALVSLGAACFPIESVFLSSWLVFGELQAKAVREEMFTGMLEKEMEWYDLREDGIGTLLIRIQTQIRELQLGVSQPLGFLVYEIFASLAALAVAFYYSWKLTFVLIAAFPIAAIILALITRPLGPAIEIQKRELTRASKYANTAITAISVVKAYNGQDHEVWQYFDTIKNVAASYLVQARTNAFQFGIVKFVMMVIFVQGFWFGLYLLNHGLQPGNILTAFYACLTAMQAVEIVLPQWLVLTKGMSAGVTLKAIRDEMQNQQRRKRMVEYVVPESCSGDIEIKRVTFNYQSKQTSQQQSALHSTNFFFPAGETTFIVGASGSGKSTVASLLMRYYNPAEGEIFIDGRPIETLDADWLRRNVTLVQQQSILFNETVLQNIAFGKSNNVTRQDVIEAGKTSDLAQTILELPKGLDTLVGSNGKSLSGGQQQRINIARARLRDAPIVILDEATSALDPKSTEKVMKEIRKWRKGKTTIIITHHVSQIQDTEYVYVLEHGAVVQEGYRQKLAEKSHGTFASFLPTSRMSAEESTEQWERRQSESYSPTSAMSGAAQPWGYIGKTFGMQETPLPNNFNVRGSQLFSLGTATAHASEVLAEKIWSTPIPQNEDGVFQPFQSSAPRLLSVPLRYPNSGPSSSFQTPILSNSKNNSNDHGAHIPLHHHASLSKAAQPVRTRPALMLDTSISNGQLLPIQPNQDLGTQAQIPLQPDLPPGLPKVKPMSLTDIFATIWPILAWRDRCMLVLGIISIICVAAATPAFAFVFSQLLSVYYLTSNRTAQAEKWALILLGIALVDGIAIYWMHYALENTGQAWVNALRLEALKRILAQPMSWFDKEKNSPAKLNESLDRNAEEMRNLIGRFAGLILTAALMLLISIVWSMIISWRLTLVTMACGPVIYANTRLFNWTSGKWEQKCNQASNHTASIFTETFANIRVVRALTLEDFFTRKHMKAAKETYRIGVRRAVYSGTLFGLGDAIGYFVIATIFYYGTTLVSSGELSVTSTIEVINLLLFGLANTMSMMSLVPQINSSRTTAARMIYLANLPQRASHETAGDRRLATPFPIVLNELSFSYPSRKATKTLSHISMTITAGSCTALVGPSGSGKSTIASILLGLYPPDSTSLNPSLTFASVPVQNCNATTLRSFISIVAQSPFLFPTTILANITYGLPEGSPFANSSSAVQAAEDAGIHEFIMSLPNGYATLIGDGGMGIAGGQAQRIAIARALVRRPKILILDEATSALDAISAEVIRETTRKLIQRGREAGEGGTAVLLISHSVEMMRIADRVVVLEDGEIKETGTFNGLRESGGALTRLIGRWDGDPGIENDDSDEAYLEGMRKMMTPVDARSKETWIGSPEIT